MVDGVPALPPPPPPPEALLAAVARCNEACDMPECDVLDCEL